MSDEKILDIKDITLSDEEKESFRNAVMLNHEQTLPKDDPILIFGTITKVAFKNFTNEFNENLNVFTHKLRTEIDELEKKSNENIEKTGVNLKNIAKEYSDTLAKNYDEKSRVVLQSINDKLITETKKNEELEKKVSQIQNKNSYLYALIIAVLMLQGLIVYLLF